MSADADASEAPEQEVQVYPHQIVAPEGLAVKYIRGVDLGDDATGEILNALAYEATFNSGVLAVRLRVA